MRTVDAGKDFVSSCVRNKLMTPNFNTSQKSLFSLQGSTQHTLKCITKEKNIPIHIPIVEIKLNKDYKIERLYSTGILSHQNQDKESQRSLKYFRTIISNNREQYPRLKYIIITLSAWFKFHIFTA